MGSSKKRKQAANTLPSKRHKSNGCACLIVDPSQCVICAKIARKIERLYGKRVGADQDGGSSSKVGDEKESSSAADNEQGTLVVADKPCACPSLSPDECDACSAFAVKLGAFVNTRSKQLQCTRKPKYPSDCDCSFINPSECSSCDAISQHIKRLFGKNLSVTISLSPTLPRRYVAIDCEMVGVAGRKSALARCSIVDEYCSVLLDIYVRPAEPVQDYRTPWSGIRPFHMKNATPMSEAKLLIHTLLEDKIVVGHSIENDYRAIEYTHPPHLTRDIVNSPHLVKKYYEKAKITPGSLKAKVGLKKLSGVLLGALIQRGSHCSVEDSIHTMKLFLLVKEAWESSLSQIQPPRQPGEESRCSQLAHDEYLQDHFWTTVKTQT